jgi:tetratricopeptide (TPR) repeat protein
MLSQLTNNKCLYVKENGCVLLLDDNDEYIIIPAENPNEPSYTYYIDKDNKPHLVYKVRYLLVISTKAKSILDTEIYNAVKNNNVDTIEDRSINLFLGDHILSDPYSAKFEFWSKIPLYTSQNDNRFTRVYEYIAHKFKSDGYNDKAIEYYDILLKTSIRNKDYKYIERTFNQLNNLRHKVAEYYEEINEYENAIKYYEQIIMSENTISTLNITLDDKMKQLIMLSLSKLTKIYYRLYFSTKIEKYKTKAENFMKKHIDRLKNFYDNNIKT